MNRFLKDFFPHVSTTQGHVYPGDRWVLEIIGHPWLPKWLIREKARDWWLNPASYRLLRLERPSLTTGRGPRVWVATFEAIK